MCTRCRFSNGLPRNRGYARLLMRTPIRRAPVSKDSVSTAGPLTNAWSSVRTAVSPLRVRVTVPLMTVKMTLLSVTLSWTLLPGSGMMMRAMNWSPS